MKNLGVEVVLRVPLPERHGQGEADDFAGENVGSSQLKRGPTHFAGVSGSIVLAAPLGLQEEWWGVRGEEWKAGGN